VEKRAGFGREKAPSKEEKRGKIEQVGGERRSSKIRGNKEKVIEAIRSQLAELFR